MKTILLVLISTMVGCANIPPEVREFMPEVSYGVKASSDPLGVVSRGLQVVQTAIGHPCPTANTDITYKHSTRRGIKYDVDCTQ